jgi:ABC-type Fe3+/spermidine/putrescine transport system ATPase subunit
MNPVIELSHLRKEYDPVVAVADLSLRVPAGSL